MRKNYKYILFVILFLSGLYAQNDFFPLAIHYDPWTAHNASEGDPFGNYNPQNYDYYLQQIKDCGINTIGTALDHGDYLTRVNAHGLKIWSLLKSNNGDIFNFIDKGYIFTSSLKQDNGKISYSKSQKGVLLK
ncbi:MAG: hypothetical protein ISR83_08960 [Candidatus Marinimicrobia bacterium]|nr:hypothetical protein [Candidatus Neomarinimicrobiota bacterium]